MRLDHGAGFWRTRGSVLRSTFDEGEDMGQVIASASMSLHGHLAQDDNTIGRLIPLGAPTVCIQGDRVTPLLFPVTDGGSRG
jgi:hypothetical protein